MGTVLGTEGVMLSLRRPVCRNFPLLPWQIVTRYRHCPLHRYLARLRCGGNWGIFVGVAQATPTKIPKGFPVPQAGTCFQGVCRAQSVRHLQENEGMIFFFILIAIECDQGSVMEHDKSYNV